MTERRFVVLIVLAVLVLSLIGILIANAIINSRPTVNDNPNPSYVVDNQPKETNETNTKEVDTSNLTEEQLKEYVKEVNPNADPEQYDITDPVNQIPEDELKLTDILISDNGETKVYMDPEGNIYEVTEYEDHGEEINNNIDENQEENNTDIPDDDEPLEGQEQTVRDRGGAEGTGTESDDPSKVSNAVPQG